MNLQKTDTHAEPNLGALRKRKIPQSQLRLDLLVTRLVMGSSADVLTEGTKQVYSQVLPLWPSELFSTHCQSPFSRSRITVAVWGSNANARWQTCGSQLHTRLSLQPQRSRIGRPTRSGTRSLNANARENNKIAAGGPGKVLIMSARTIGETQSPVVDAQTFSPTACKLAGFMSLTKTSDFTRMHSHVLRI